ncbi:hypothetical protein [Flavobacterium sp. LAR06]|uniref:hypothetical protein n=1 Tax=Flavobacterium sp. LAR06 TaxID=3064897 RepID=UPI0035BEBADA
MSNFTIEDYKTAIRANYKLAIEEDMSGVLSDPTPAQLRDFYLRLLEKGLSKIDEEIIKMFLRANENSSLKKAIENCNIEKLKPIISFLQGGNTENRQRIEMAAILINFQMRPFRKFQDEESITKEDNLPQNFFHPKSNNNEGRKDDAICKEGNGSSLKNKRKFFERLFNKSKLAMITTALIFSLIAATIYFAIIKKRCMQWSDNHYEIVTCDKPIEGNLNDVIQRDDNLLNFRKIEVCDTTICFKPNRESIVWYSKIDNKVDFFNTDGKHPISKKPLKPVSQHIVNKYAKKTLEK